MTTRLLLRPALLERTEAAALLALAVVLYGRLDGGWGRFGLLLLAPDLAALGFLVGPALGAACYNAAHAAVLPAAIAAAGVLGGSPTAASLALIWFAHVAGDRALGYGLQESGNAPHATGVAAR